MSRRETARIFSGNGYIRLYVEKNIGKLVESNQRLSDRRAGKIMMTFVA
ncbi:TPA: hypothetical protein J7708_003927 [Escherichia coli]|nr:hypothetical protein [Escherichia coli]